MDTRPFDPDAAVCERRIVVRRDDDGLELVELPWGLRPREPGGRPFTVVRAEQRVFPSHRCLLPASEFRHRKRDRRYSFSLADGDWFYFAGIWRPATQDWPEAYAILTTEANPDVLPFHDRQMAIVTRARRMEWLDMTTAEKDLLRPLPAGSFIVSAPTAKTAQSELTL